MDDHDCLNIMLYVHVTYLIDSRKTSILLRKTHGRTHVVDTLTMPLQWFDRHRKSLELGSWLLRGNSFHRRFYGIGRRHDTTGDPCCFFQDRNVDIFQVHVLHLRGSHTLLYQACTTHDRLVGTRERVMHLLRQEKWELRANFEKYTSGTCWRGEMIN
jgi:hypothetical protein